MVCNGSKNEPVTNPAYGMPGLTATRLKPPRTQLGAMPLKKKTPATDKDRLLSRMAEKRYTHTKAPTRTKTKPN